MAFAVIGSCAVSRAVVLVSPTTPNPTSGFLLFFPAEDVIELDMSVEDAAKLVISAGLVYPNDKELIETITHIK